MSVTTVDGIGSICSTPVIMTTRGINYAESNELINYHNESYITIDTQQDGPSFWPFSMGNDQTTVELSCDTSTCNVKVAMNSEAGVDLFNKGYFQLSFDRAQRQWSLKAYKEGWFSDTEWGFCSPAHSLSQVRSILTLLALDKTKDVETDCSPANFDATLKGIVQSLNQGQSGAISSAKLYSEPQDCTQKSNRVQANEEHGSSGAAGFID